MGDVYYCFTAYNDIEQEEAGDTTEHTFIMSDWPSCETRWFHLWGTIGGEASPSESPIWGRHLYSSDHSADYSLVDDKDEFYASRGGSVFANCPWGCPVEQRVGRFYDTRYVGCGLRYSSIQVPPGSAITNAQLVITSMLTTARSIYSHIQAEAVDNPTDYSGENGASMWARYGNHTAASLSWRVLTPWTLDVVYRSPSFNSVIQEVIDRPGWEQGNAIVLFWHDWAKRTIVSGNLRYAYPRNISAAKSVVLSLNYTAWRLEGVNP